MLEDARRNEKEAAEGGGGTNDNPTSAARWSTQVVSNESIDTATVTLPLRKNNKIDDTGKLARNVQRDTG